MGLPRFRYIPYDQLDGVPHVIVDGSPHKDSRLVLSHWIDSGTPRAWMRDTSAEIAIDYIERNGLPSFVEGVSSDHFDQDGLVALLAFLDADEVLGKKDLYIDVATAGDFGRYKVRKAAQVSMVLATMLNPESGFFDQDHFKKPYVEQARGFYEKAILELPRIVSDIDAYQHFWSDEDKFLRESEELLASGKVTVEEIPELDLAIVRIPEHLPPKSFHRFTRFLKAPVHDIALHNFTARGRLAYLWGSRKWFKYRYESWVQVRQGQPKLRVPLGDLANALSLIDGVEWIYTGSDKLIAELRLKSPSDVSRADEREFLGSLCDHLERGVPDWDPYR